jgi:RNA polymerase sigma factor (TIGR02999 family)
MTAGERPSGDGAVTRLLARAAEGDERAGEDALARVYDELRAIAGGYLRRERRDHTLQATALVHEAWMRLAAPGEDGWEDRRHFIGCAAHVMRQILVDHARGHGRQKRGGDRLKLTLDPDVTPPTTGGPDALDLLALDEAMNELAALDERKARLVELRFFGGLSADEAANLLGIARSTAAEEWRMARAWLGRRLRGEADG